MFFLGIMIWIIAPHHPVVYPILMKPTRHLNDQGRFCSFDRMIGKAVSLIWLELREKGVAADCLGLIPALTFRLNQALQPLKYPCPREIKANVLGEAAQAARETLIALGLKMLVADVDRCILKAFGRARLAGGPRRAGA